LAMRANAELALSFDYLNRLRRPYVGAGDSPRNQMATSPDPKACSLFRRRQIEKGQEVVGLVMRAFLFKFSAALNVHKRGGYIREMALAIFARCGGVRVLFAVNFDLDVCAPLENPPRRSVVEFNNVAFGVSANFQGGELHLPTPEIIKERLQ
jgi:hypothetical protein